MSEGEVSVTHNGVTYMVDPDFAVGGLSGLHIISSSTSPEAFFRTAFVLGQVYRAARNHHMASFYFEVAARYPMARLTEGRSTGWKQLFRKPSQVSSNLADADQEIAQVLRNAADALDRYVEGSAGEQQS